MFGTRACVLRLSSHQESLEPWSMCSKCAHTSKHLIMFIVNRWSKKLPSFCLSPPPSTPRGTVYCQRAEQPGRANGRKRLSLLLFPLCNLVLLVGGGTPQQSGDHCFWSLIGRGSVEHLIISCSRSCWPLLLYGRTAWHQRHLYLPCQHLPCK